MGYCNYYISRLKSGLDLKTPEYSDHNFNAYDMYNDDGELFNQEHVGKLTRRFNSSYCRELLMADFGVGFLSTMNPQDNKMGVFAVRCFGAVYDNVCKYFLSKKSSTKRVEKFLNEMFDMNMHIVPEILDVSDASGLFPIQGRYITSDDVELDIRGTITLYFNSWENPEYKKLYPSFMSLLLGMFREKRIMEKIVRKEITNASELISEFFSIAIARTKYEDTDYPQYLVVDDLDKGTMESIDTEIKAFLSSWNNDEGSDGYSMILAGVYLAAKLCLDEVQISEGWTGPIYTARNMEKDPAEKVVDYLDNLIPDTKLKLKVGNILEISTEYESSNHIYRTLIRRFRGK